MRSVPRFRLQSRPRRAHQIHLEQLEAREVPHAVGAYSFDAGTGTTLTDLSGNGNHGTIAGATWTGAGRYGGAMSFDGVNDLVNIPDAASLDLTTGFTLEAWVKPSVAFQGGWTTVVFKERPGDGTFALFGHTGNGRPGTGFNTAAGDFLASAPGALVGNIWTHLAATYDGSSLIFYVNGAAVGSQPATGLITTSGLPVRIGGNTIFPNEFFQGVIDEVQIHNHARTAAEIQQDMNTPLELDVTPPAVLSVAPVPNATAVNPESNITARFTENLNPATVSAATVELRGPTGAVVPVAVGYDVNTQTITLNPTDTLAMATTYTAVLKGGPSGLTDQVGNAMAANYTWSFQTGTPANPGTVGLWSPVMDWSLVAINQVLLKDGRVLMWDGGPDCIGSQTATVWNPATNSFTPVPIPYAIRQDDDIFCSGQTVLADGRVLVVGGHDCDGPNAGIPMTNIFDPATMTWTRGPDTIYARWYPTVTLLPDGKALVTSGSDVSTTSYIPIPEVYDPVTNTWTTLPSANMTIPNYPFVFVLPDGRILAAGSDEGITPTRILDLTTQTWTTVDSRLLDGGSAVMYRPGKVMKSGSSRIDGSAGATSPAFPTTYAIDLTQASPAYRQTASMAYPRSHHNLTILPDGSVFATGGSTTLSGAFPDTAVFPTEIWNPVTETWSLMASLATPRMYHSTAMLLPDGRVLAAGGGRNFVNNISFLSAEVYSPPYLFRGPRPVVTAAPADIEYGTSFFVGTANGAGIASVALIKNGSVTHQVNMDQRYVPLTFTQTVGGLTVQAPANANLAPPGYYMLFIVDTNGVPSVAPIVRFAAAYEDTQPPTAPGNLTATGGLGTANLSWTAATDNRAVIGYRIYRSTTPNFTPSTANQVGTTTGTSYVSTGMAGGTYYFRVTAYDAAGNVGPSSNEQSVVVGSDSTPPTVGMTAPAAGATVTGSATVSANASDNVGVVGVQFLLDGQPLGAEDTTAPYSVSWNTTAIPNGSYTLSARARDGAGNATTSAGVPVTVSNAAPAGLVLALGFDEATGTAVADASGIGNNGTISGATRVAGGRFGGTLSFDGVNDWVTVPHATSLDLTTGLTLEAWVKPAVAMPGGAWTTILFKERPSVDGNYGLFGHMGTGVPGLGFNTPAGDILQLAPSGLPVGTWTHLAATFGSGTVTFYVNGVAVGTRTAAGPITTSVAPLRVGGNSIFGEWFNGAIDEVRVYNRALSASEVASDMNTPVGDAPPSVTSVSPAANAGGVAGTAVVTATFSEAVNAATVTTATFELRGPGGVLVPATVAFNSASSTATLTPNAALSSATAYTALLKGGPTGVADLTGNRMAADFSWTFTTADFVAPTVTAVTPADGATGVDPIGNITATFSEAMAAATVTTASFELRGPGGVVVPATVTYNAATRTATIDPNGLLGSLTGYTAFWRGGSTGARVTDLAGNPLVADYSWSFTTADVPDLAVIGVSPAANALGVSAGAMVTVTFSEPVDPATIAAGSFEVRGPGGVVVPAALSYDSTTRTVTLDPTSPLASSTGYTAVVRGGTSGPRIIDLTGNPLAAEYTWSFTVADTIAPTVAMTAPAAGSTVTGAATVSANASDDVGVVGVQFLLNGQPLGTEDTTAPYSVSWASTGTPNGSYTLTARARDAAGNATTSAGVPVTVNNTVSTGLVLALGFNEGTGGAVTDASGTGNNGTISGATWTTAGKYGGALSFDGVNDLVTIPDANSLDLTTGMTLEAWVKPAAAQSGWRTVIFKERPGDGSYALFRRTGGPQPGTGINTAAGDVNAQSSSNLTTNTWAHLAATYDGAVLTFYVNGVVKGSRTGTGLITTSNGAVRIGGNTVFSNEWVSGLIDEVRIYDRARTAAEIQADMNTPVGGGGGNQTADQAARLPDPDRPNLTAAELAPLMEAAVARWAAAGLPAGLLPVPDRIPIQIADLPGSTIGYTDSVSGQVWIDVDAAGHGWFIDATPGYDAEFSRTDTPTVAQAAAGPAAGVYDLLSVLTHELGHLLGIADFPVTSTAGRPADLMDYYLSAGTRRQPSELDVRLATAGMKGELTLEAPVSVAVESGPLQPSLWDMVAVPFTGTLVGKSPVARIEQRLEPDSVSGVALLDPVRVGTGEVSEQRSDDGFGKDFWTAEPLATDPNIL